MGEADRRVGPVDVLTPSTRCPKDIHLEIIIADLDLDLVVEFREYCDSTSACVDSTLTLCRRNPLDAMDAGLEFEPAIGPVSPYGADDFLIPPDITLGRREDLKAETALLRLAAVHSK